ncbi:MAG: hypothetical protein O2819_00800 [Planctomycetota bacterium]|nr:hypothetical protein [Planctomycetota bacterium]MDA1105680.1 hypothetical protein [Planctomycetota bacterium]
MLDTPTHTPGLSQDVATSASPLLLAALAIACGILMLASNSNRVRQWRRSPAISAVSSLGALPLLLGIACGPLGADFIDGETARKLQPLFVFACACVALIVGLQGRARVLRSVPRTLWAWSISDLLLAAGGATIGVLVAYRAQLVAGTFEVTLLGSGMFVALAGWNPETRSLRVLLRPESRRIAVLVQAGAGLVALLAISLSSAGISLLAPLALLRALLAGGAIVFAGWLIFAEDVPEESQRIRKLIALVGMVAFAAGAAGLLDVGPMLLALIVGLAVANVRGRLLEIDDIAPRIEPMAAWLVQFGAGLYGGSAPGPLWMIALLALLLIAVRTLLKPAMMRDRLLSEANQVDLSSPLMQATVRQAPLAVALCLNFSLLVPSVAMRQLLLVVALAGPLGAMAPLGIAFTRRVAMDLRTRAGSAARLAGVRSATLRQEPRADER